MKLDFLTFGSEHFERVLELSRKNSSTLGFLPEGAFRQYTDKQQILIALNAKDELVGYLVYGVNRREMLVYIVHLCVEVSYRRQGIARALVDKLKSLTGEFYKGIRVRCRRDYEASKVWGKYNFRPINDMPGRSKNKDTVLTVWWYDYGHPNLFTLIDKQRSKKKLKVAIDANVFFDLQAPSNNQESQSLLSDWLQETVVLCITDEIDVEINRNADRGVRAKAHQFAETFVRLQSSDKKFHQACKKLQEFFPNELKGVDP